LPLVKIIFRFLFIFLPAAPGSKIEYELFYVMRMMIKGSGCFFNPEETADNEMYG
jgi:hypothetical protein